jgi:hypothetical protein
MIGHTTSSAASVRLSSYVEKVADLAGVGFAAPLRRGCDRRIDAACLHLAGIHSMPLHRIVEVVARAIARRARNGTRSSERGGRRPAWSRRHPERAQRVEGSAPLR